MRTYPTLLLRWVTAGLLLLPAAGCQHTAEREATKTPAPQLSVIRRRIYPLPQPAVWQALLDIMQEGNVSLALLDSDRGYLQSEWVVYQSYLQVMSPELDPQTARPIWVYAPCQFKLEIATMAVEEGTLVQIRCHLRYRYLGPLGSTDYESYGDGYLETKVFQQVEDRLDVEPLQLPAPLLAPETSGTGGKGHGRKIEYGGEMIIDHVTYKPGALGDKR